jgi:hypothetical protein
MNIIV